VPWSSSARCGFFVAKGDGSILDSDNTAIGNCHLEDIRSEVFQTGTTFAHGLTVDVPVGFPNVGRDLVHEAGSLHVIPEFGPEDFG